MSDNTSRRCFECCWRQCEASLPDWLNELAKAPCVLLSNSREYQQYSCGICFSARRAHSSFTPSSSIYSSSLFHNLVFLLEEQRVSNYLRAIHYKWHPPHCTAEIFGVQKKMGFAFTLCSSVLMKREIEGRKAFIFWQNATPGHEYLLLLSDYLLCEESVKESWSYLREHGEKVWSVAVNHLEEAFTIQVTWERFIMPQKRSNPEEASHLHHHSTTTLHFYFCRCIVPRSLNMRVILNGNSCGNQTFGGLPRSWPEIK